MNEQNLLSGLLTLVTDPKLVKENIVLLQKHIADNKEMSAEAKRQQELAEQRHREADKKDADLKRSIFALDERLKQFEGEKQTFEDMRLAHIAEYSKFTDRLTAHLEAEKTLDGKQKKLASDQSKHTEKITADDNRITAANTALAAREEKLHQDILAFENEKTAFKSKVEAVKKLAV